MPKPWRLKSCALVLDNGSCLEYAVPACFCAIIIGCSRETAFLTPEDLTSARKCLLRENHDEVGILEVLGVVDDTEDFCDDPVVLLLL